MGVKMEEFTAYDKDGNVLFNRKFDEGVPLVTELSENSEPFQFSNEELTFEIQGRKPNWQIYKVAFDYELLPIWYKLRVFVGWNIGWFGNKLKNIR